MAISAGQLNDRLRQAGWRPADPPTLKNLPRLLQQGMNYSRAPLAPVFWNGRINDLAFERPVRSEGGPAIDTLRIWKTPWLVHGAPLFVGVTRSYTGLSWGVIHRISPDVDATAERLVRSLRRTTPTPIACKLPLLDRPQIGTYLLGMQYFTRGELWLVDLDPPDASPAVLCGSNAVATQAQRAK